MKEFNILPGTTSSITGCPVKPFRIIKLTAILLLFSVLNVFGGVSVSDEGNLNPDKKSGSETDLQQNQVTGTITDEQGNPLPGVTVLIKGTTIGTLSDNSGRYTLNNVPQNSILVFSFVGSATQEIPLNRPDQD